MPTVSFATDIYSLQRNLYVSTPGSNNVTNPYVPNASHPQVEDTDAELNGLNTTVIGGIIGAAAAFIALVTILVFVFTKRRQKHESQHQQSCRQKELPPSKPEISSISHRGSMPNDYTREPSQFLGITAEYPHTSVIHPELSLSVNSKPAEQQRFNNDALSYNVTYPGSPVYDCCEETVHHDYEMHHPTLSHANTPKKLGLCMRMGATGPPPADTVSNCASMTGINGAYGFSRGIPTRRSRSLETLSQNEDDEARRCAKSATMASHDSGFSSVFSIPRSPVTPTSTQELSLYSSQCSAMSYSTQCSIDVLIKEGISRFYSIPNRRPGQCYASSVFAIGEFDSRGGELRPAGDTTIRLTISAGALNRLQLVYLLVLFENNRLGDNTENFSPTVECGPDGLEFQVPVTLTFPHAAVNTEVEALTSEGGSAAWHVDHSSTGPTLHHTTAESVSLTIHHFTKFKLSSSSRIPVRSLGVGSSKPSSPSGKKLSVAVYKCGEKARIYFICKTSPSSTLPKMINERERTLGFFSDSPWKDFTFYSGHNGLVIEASRDVHGQRCPVKKFNFNDEKVLSAYHESVEIMATESPMVLDINVYQPDNVNNYIQFCIKLEKDPSPLASSVSAEWKRVMEYQQLHTMMMNLELQSQGSRNDAGQHLTISTDSTRPPGYSRSVSDVVRAPPSIKTPEEHCEHSPYLGACSCWKDASRSPVESEYDAASNLRRGVANRRSKESGYESCTIQSPLVSPLKGPNSIAALESTSLELDFQLDTRQSGQIDPVTHQIDSTEL